ncbi:unnamed protein product [Discosporangium mesarthrocarpum]
MVKGKGKGKVEGCAAVESLNSHGPLRSSLFDPSVVARMCREYQESTPYRHLVIPNLLDDRVLRDACGELKKNMQATLKETDIYKVYQAGDLSNLDGLPEESKCLLPSLFSLRGALYSLKFRRLVQKLTGSGPLSGERIDLSVNAYGHTGHLLCHDDVIGTREVSYILYLVDEDWGSREKSDGGGLQLYPLEKDGVPGVPAYAPSKVIPPKWNQMVLFAVQPGRSFHDVQEVYNEFKPRLAVSGWFHGALPSELEQWPQCTPSSAPGTTGEFRRIDLEEGSEEKAAMATLAQLEGGEGGEADNEGLNDDSGPGEFSGEFVGEEGLDSLSNWVNNEYLSPSMVEQCAEAFRENGSTLQLHRFLKLDFSPLHRCAQGDVAKKIVEAVRASDHSDGLGYMEASDFEAGVRGGWRKCGPPHQQRMLRLSQEPPGQTDEEKDDEVGVLMREIRDKLFHTRAFKSLLEGIVGAAIAGCRCQVRRFRPGLDYTLATPEAPWEWKGASKEGATDKGSCGNTGAAGGQSRVGVRLMVLDVILCFVDDHEPYKEAAWRQDEVGGYVTYLGGDEAASDGNKDGNDKEHKGPGCGSGSGREGVGKGDARGSEEGAPDSKTKGTPAGGDGHEDVGGGSGGHDAAVYKADEEGSLVSVSAASNALTLVLRDDINVLSFVKYVSSAAPGSRFDAFGEFLVPVEEDSDSDDKQHLMESLETVEEENEEVEEEGERGDSSGDGMEGETEEGQPGKKRARLGP